MASILERRFRHPPPEHHQNGPGRDVNNKHSSRKCIPPTTNNADCNNRQLQTERRKVNGRHDDDNNNISEEINSEIVTQLRKRLSLPCDVPIPESILSRHKDKLSPATTNAKPWSRVARRLSLLEIGFGQSSTYYKLSPLGSGTYSIVYKGTSRLTNKLVALKEIHLQRDEGVPFTAIREVSILKELRHNNIITLHDIIYTSRTLTLVFEFVDRDLSRYMDECEHRINIHNVRIFLYQLLRALKYCHDRRIMHRDLKPQNILISLSGELKLADFGLARSKSVPTKTFTDEVVTLWYRPPDVLLGNVDYGTSIDMWGVGCIFFEMAAGVTLFASLEPRKQIETIFGIIGTPDEASWPGIRSDLESCAIQLVSQKGRDLASLAPRLSLVGVDLLLNFLKCNPLSRISASEAMYHAYFNSLPSQIHSLSDLDSIFSIPSIKLLDEQQKEPTENV